MRAVEPTRTDTVDRDGVAIFYEVYENDGPTIMLIPPAPITHSRIFKGQIPYLARHYRVVTFDGRGNGQSGRPFEPEDHTMEMVLGDILAVIEATDSSEIVLVAHCHANWWALQTALGHPEQTVAMVAIEPGIPYVGPSHAHWAEGPDWDEVLENPTGWELNTRHAIVTRHRDWIEFFFSQQLVEPHSTKQYEDAVDWALESTGEVLAAGEEGFEMDFPDRETVEASCRSLGIPTLTIHGDLDVCQHIDRGRAFAEITGGELVTIEGAGHLSLARDPVKVNHAVKEFVERVAA